MALGLISPSSGQPKYAVIQARMSALLIYTEHICTELKHGGFLRRQQGLTLRSMQYYNTASGVVPTINIIGAMEIQQQVGKQRQ